MLTLEVAGSGSTQTRRPLEPTECPGLTRDAFQACRSSTLPCFLKVPLSVSPHRGYDRDEALILMSTPAGRLNLLSASIVLAVA